MKIFLVRVSIDWHNMDTQDLTYAYDDEEMAVKRMKREVTEIKSAIKRQEREIEWERTDDKEYSAASSADDYINVWVEAVNLNHKRG